MSFFTLTQFYGNAVIKNFAQVFDAHFVVTKNICIKWMETIIVKVLEGFAGCHIFHLTLREAVTHIVTSD